MQKILGVENLMDLTTIYSVCESQADTPNNLFCINIDSSLLRKIFPNSRKDWMALNTPN